MNIEEKKQNLEQLTKKFSWVNGKFWQFMFGLMSCGTDIRQGGVGIECMLISCAEDLYPGEPDKQREMIENHMVYFNTETIMGSFVPGAVLGMEVERAKGNTEITNEAIQSVKTALSGPFAGIGDSIVQGMLIPIIISIAIGLSQDGSPLGAIFMFVAYMGICYPLSFYMFKLGMNMGITGAEKILASEAKDRLLNCVNVLGLIVVGGVTASVTKISTPLAFSINGAEFALQDYLDQIYKGLLPLLAAMGVFYLMKNKKMSPLKVMGLLMVISIVGYFIGVL